MTFSRVAASQAVSAAGEDGLLAVVTQARPEAELPGGGDLYAIGTGAIVRQFSQRGQDTVMVVLEGVERIGIIDVVQTHPYLRARVRRLTSERPHIDSTYTAMRSNFDLEKVKERILEFLAVQRLRRHQRGPLICLVGPPGVGKTSVGRSIARATGREFVRISLGGTNDEAEIILPMDNEPNLNDEVPAHLRGDLTIRLASTIEQAIDLALSLHGGIPMAHQTIRDVMTKNVLCVSEDATIREVARKMRDQNIGDVLVTDDDGRLCGILTDRDIVVRAIAEGRDPDQLHASDICSGQIVTLDPSSPIDEAIRLMREKAVRRIPVIENDRPVGIVSIGDLAQQRDPNSALGQISAASPNI